MLNYEIRDTKTGQGLFSLKQFENNQVILQFEGEQVNINNKDADNNYLQIGSELFLDMSGKYSFYINHHCQPNCYVKIMVNKAFLVAGRPIKKNDELFFDYSTTSSDNLDEWDMKCNCHEFYCRKIISGFQTLAEDVKKKMINNVPNYLLK